MNGFESNLVDRYYCTLYIDTSLTDLDLDSRSQNVKLLCQLSQFSTDLNEIWCTIETCWCDKPHTQFILSILLLLLHSPAISLAFTIWMRFLRT